MWEHLLCFRLSVPGIIFVNSNLLHQLLQWKIVNNINVSVKDIESITCTCLLLCGRTFGKHALGKPELVKTVASVTRERCWYTSAARCSRSIEAVTESVVDILYKQVGGGKVFTSAEGHLVTSVNDIGETGAESDVYLALNNVNTCTHMPECFCVFSQCGRPQPCSRLPGMNVKLRLCYRTIDQGRRK